MFYILCNLHEQIYLFDNNFSLKSYINNIKITLMQVYSMHVILSNHDKIKNNLKYKVFFEYFDNLSKVDQCFFRW